MKERREKMKFKTTKKEIMCHYGFVCSVAYCQLQYLLQYENPVAYISNTSGWRADIYEVNRCAAIVTGYGPFGDYAPSYELCQKYEKQAKSIIFDYNNLTFKEKRKKLKQLINSFIKESLNELNEVK